MESIVVLGARLVWSEAGELRGAAGRRARAAAELYAMEPRLVVACGGCAWEGLTEADAIACELERRGVPREDVVRERLSLSTRENARYAAIALGKGGIDRAVVVTCDWHLPRALRAFAREGIVARGHGAPGPTWGPIKSAYVAARERLAERIDTWR